MSTLVTDFAQLFRSRTDVYGTDRGGCVRINNTIIDRNAYWAELWAEHLVGNKPLGIYPILADNTVWWGCVDIDVGDKPGALYANWHSAYQHSLLLTRVLAHMSIEGWIEQTRSGGAHIWVYASEPVPAHIMRRALLAAHQIADLPQKEVNPKQETLQPGQVGNYVRAPYPHSTERQRIITADKELTAQEFAHQALETRMPANIFELAAALYREPARPVASPSSFSEFLHFEKIGNKGRYIETVIANGPAGTDRSDWLWKLARILRENDVPYELAWSIFCEADRRHGKFGDRKDGQVQLERLLQKAYQ